MLLSEGIKIKSNFCLIFDEEVFVFGCFGFFM